MNTEIYNFETPFADTFVASEEKSGNGISGLQIPVKETENPFTKTYETADYASGISPIAGEIVNFLGELHDPGFTRNLYELASELEDSWTPLVSNEAVMGEGFLPFVKQRADDYFRPLIKASDGMFDRIKQRISANSISGMSETDVELFLNEFQPDTAGLTPVQEQFLGSVFNKVRNAVKAGVKAVSKILPVNIILDKLKGLIRPLLDRVLKFAIGKLPKNLQPYAQTLAKKLLNMETPFTADSEESAIPSAGETEAIQTEFDSRIANMVYSADETVADQFVMEYETIIRDSNNGQFATDTHLPSLETARQRFIHELSELQHGESPAPAIERFLPAAIMALQPIIKMGISVIGRPKVINFLAGLLAKLVEKYVPQNVAKPLAASIIDAGMSVIGFETYDASKPDVGYEAIVNTIEDTVQNMGNLRETDVNDQETLTIQLLEAFENAAVANFPPQYIRQDLRSSNQPGVWVNKPREGSGPVYKKYTTVFSVSIDPQKAKTITTFRDLPLSSFLRDKLGIDVSKTVRAKVHLFEAINGTRLSRIHKFENLPGLNASIPYSWVQLHPLTKQASALLIGEPALGKDFDKKYTAKRQLIATGQRFYYLEIDGARLRTGTGKTNRPAHSDDVQGVVNFVTSSLRFNYYFSEEQSRTIVEKLNRNDMIGAASGIRQSVKGVLHNMIKGNVSQKVKIIHEAFPELYFENYTDGQENLMGVGKGLLTHLIESLVNKVSSKAYDEIRDFFKSRTAEFKQAQAEPQDGVTIRITWKNVAGLSGLKSVISAVRGNQVIIPGSLSFPNLGKPDIEVKAGKQLD